MTPENEAKKEYLNRYHWCAKALEQVDREITQLRLRALPGGINYDGMPHGSGVNHADLANYASKLDEYITKRREKKEELIRTLEEITDAVDAMADERSQILLRYKYIENKTWREVAVLMDYDESYVKRELHSEALQKFKLPTKSYEEKL